MEGREGRSIMEDRWKDWAEEKGPSLPAMSFEEARIRLAEVKEKISRRHQMRQIMSAELKDIDLSLGALREEELELGKLLTAITVVKSGASGVLEINESEFARYLKIVREEKERTLDL